MTQKIVCGNCGGKVPLPAGYSKAKIRCGNCGYYAEVPPDQRSAAPPDDEPAPPSPKKVAPNPPPAPPNPVTDRPRKKKAKLDDPPAKPVARRRADPRDTRPEFVGEEGAGRPLIQGNQDEDDASPYTVHGSGLKDCPHCRGQLPLDALFCVHCGESLDEENTRPGKAKRTYTEIDETFVEGWTLTTRGIIFGVAQVVNVFVVLAGMAAGSLDKQEGESKFDPVSLGTVAVVSLFHTALQAFIIGTFDALTVRRTDRGQATLVRNRRIAFIPMQQEKIKWKKCAGVGRLATHAGDVFAWITAAYLFFCLFCLPGILFWWFVLKPDRYDVVLCDLYGGIEETVYRGKGKEQADRVAEVVSEATTLELRGVL